MSEPQSLSSTANIALTPNEVEDTVERTFGGVEYIIGIRMLGDAAISVDLERKSDGDRWRGDFSAKYIEEITAKTGNYKKFTVFVRMLLSALRSESESVLMDLLTFADLEALRARRAGQTTASQASASQALQSSNKRYLILTYVAEFDRVHYPLPLAFDESPDPEQLKQIIRRLREQLEVSKQALGPRAARVTEVVAEVRRLREENANLRANLKRLEGERTVEAQEDLERVTTEAFEASRELRVTRKERDLLKERCGALEEALDAERSKGARQTRRLERELEEAREEAARAKEQLKELRLKNRDLTTELEVMQRRAASRGVPAASPYNPGATTGRAASASKQRPPSTTRVQSARAHNDTPPRYRAGYAQPPQPPPPARDASRGRSTSASSRRPSAERPRSATPSGRFDPTAWVRQQQDRKRSQEQQKRKTFTPPSSRPQSGASTPTRERSPNPPSARRGGGGVPSYMEPTASSRSLNVSRTNLRSPSPAARGAQQPPSARNNNAPAPPRNAWAASPQGKKEGSFRSSNAAPMPQAESPGRALQEVRNRLGQLKDEGPAPTGQPVIEQSGGDLDGTSQSLADVDARLQRLQAFLQEAKSSAA